jgi:S-adenosylmethionine:tRNA ribosyltransferase-isomerase
VAPSAALQFSRELLKLMEINDINHTFITLHASLGNFREIDVEDLTKHKTDSEQLIVSEEACQVINSTQDKKRRICAIGTTVMRALETAVCTEGHVKTYDGWTNKFIFPPYDFTVADSMIANFQLPYSTLLMMICAFGDYDKVMNAYDVALKEGYRFGTYGDAMLII